MDELGQFNEETNSFLKLTVSLFPKRTHKINPISVGLNNKYEHDSHSLPMLAEL